MKYIRKINENNGNSFLNLIKYETYILEDLKSEKIIETIYYKEYISASHEEIKIEININRHENLPLEKLQKVIIEISHIINKLSIDYEISIPTIETEDAYYSITLNIYKQIKPEINQINIDDLLSANESVSEIIDKVKYYGKKGLLTTSLLLSLAGNLSAQNKDVNSIMKVGLEYTDNITKAQLYNAVIGLSTKYTSLSMQKSDIESAGAFKEISIYYTKLRDNQKVNELSDLAKKHLKVIFSSLKKYNDKEMLKLVRLGSTIKRAV